MFSSRKSLNTILNCIHLCVFVKFQSSIFSQTWHLIANVHCSGWKECLWLWHSVVTSFLSVYEFNWHMIRLCTLRRLDCTIAVIPRRCSISYWLFFLFLTAHWHLAIVTLDEDIEWSSGIFLRIILIFSRQFLQFPIFGFQFFNFFLEFSQSHSWSRWAW